jgi:hypothetical protein
MYGTRAQRDAGRDLGLAAQDALGRICYALSKHRPDAALNLCATGQMSDRR